MSAIFPLERARRGLRTHDERHGRVFAGSHHERQLKHRIRVHGVLNAMNLFNGISRSTLSPKCLADGIPFTGPLGWY